MYSTRSVVLFFCAVLGVVKTLADPGDDGCILANSSGFLLPLANFSNSGAMCPPGYYCPNSILNDSSTWPVICPPTQACLAMRLNQQYCPPQGLYEPTVCPSGSYCPNGFVKLECPSGYRCPPGSTSPYECSGLSSCPAGSGTEYFLGSILVVVLVDMAVVAAYIALRRYLALPTPLTDVKADEPAANTAARLIREALGTSQPVQISFENLSVRLSKKHATAPNKSLLQGVSGSLRAGEVTAIMGPSGAGKTVLFTTVLGKTPTDWTVEGTLRVCGDRTPQDFPHLVGFVPQDDVLRGDLTVAENILYSSEVRLPADWSAERRRELRSAVMRALGIDHVRDVLIGDEETRGVSGGQRKRCSVAVELAAAPAVIFLDEPTTGLDATSSLELVRLLKIVAREARIPVAMVIHQPRVEIWNELDAVLLLAPGGRTVYSGRRHAAEDMFREMVSFGRGNPADLILDAVAANGQVLADQWQVEHSTLPATLVAPLLIQERTAVQSGGDARGHAMRSSLADTLTGPEDELSVLGPTRRATYGTTGAASSQQQPLTNSSLDAQLLSQPSQMSTASLVDGVVRLRPESNVVEQVSAGIPSRVLASPWKQIVMAHLRSVVGQQRNAAIFLFDVLLGGVGGALLTKAALNAPFVGPLKGAYFLLSPWTTYQNLSMLIMLWGFALAGALGPAGARAFGATRRTYWREASSGYSRVAYYIGASAAQLYRVTLTALHFSVIVYLMWRPNMMFGSLFGVLLLYCIAIDAQSALLGIVLTPQSAALAATIVGVFGALLNGFPQIPAVSNYAYSFGLTEMAYHYEVNDVLQVFAVSELDNDFGYDVDNLGYDWGLFLAWFVVLKGLGYLLLIWTHRDKQR